MRNRLTPLASLAAMAFAAVSAAQFSDDFEVDSTANWQFNSSQTADGTSDNFNNEANFFFDYSTVGIPLAPHSSSGGTRGLKMEANVFGTTTGVLMGMSASPIGQHFSGDYKLSFDCWQNFQGPFPGGGSGTSQLTLAGLGSTDGLQFIGGPWTAVGFAATGDGGSTIDYRAYVDAGAPLSEASGAYAAGTGSGVRNNTNSYYSSFQGTVPAAQTAYASGLGFGSQTGSTNVGALGMAWRYWEIEKIGDTVTWTVDGKLIATITGATAQMGSDNIFIGYGDINTTASTDAISRQLLFGLVDNVHVTPEPGSLAVLGLGILALARRRK